jgi:hypothetical protein
MTDQPDHKQPPRPKALVAERRECEIKVELLYQVIGEVASLSVKNNEESPLRDEIVYNPNWDALLQYCFRGDCVLVTCRYDGTLVGYSLALIGQFERSMGTLYAQIEAFYILPAFRDFKTAKRLKDCVEKELEDRVQFILIGSDPGGSIATIFGRFGYKPVEVIMYKRLKDVGEESPSGSA